VSDPRGRASVPFDRIAPGDPVGTWRYEVTREAVERHRRATQQEPYPDAELAPVSLFAADGVNLADRFWDISQSVHAGQRLRVEGLARIGQVLTVTGVARDKFTKRGRRYVTSEILTADERGVVLARGLMTGVLVYGEGETSAEASGSAAAPGAAAAGPVAAASAGPAPPGAKKRLAPLVRTMTREAMVLYEPPGEVNLHTDDATARAAGLPASIATGTLVLAYVFDLLYRSYGPASLLGTEVDVRLRRPVFAGDRVETGADVLGTEAGRIRHAVRCQAPLGDAVVGSAWVPEPSR
jgi:acyl dehydratase